MRPRWLILQGKSCTERDCRKSGDFWKDSPLVASDCATSQCNSFVIPVFTGCPRARETATLYLARLRRAPVMNQSSRRSFSALVCVPVIVIGLAARMDASEPSGTLALQELVDDLKTQLGINSVVSAAIVTSNSLVVSVQRVHGDPGTFRMEFDERFLPSLDQDELKAVIAHELGHVWIYTHHPYLQTERGANMVAMRAVPRASLERVYGKVWDHQGTKGDLTRFLGPE
jgi:Peptidase family M48